MSFDYIIDKILAAPIERAPFDHLYIHNLFEPEHFAEIIAAPEIALHNLDSDIQLFDTLFENGWKIISFPGCITDKKIYLDWHKNKSQKQTQNNSSCEGFGMTLRLSQHSSDTLQRLSTFLQSEKFQHALASRFSITPSDVVYDWGIQKYLDGYEISPHPDIRRKALTYMVNINPSPNSEKEEHHTHYLTFKDAYKYVESYWDGHPHQDRCWVPWDWCDTHKIQSENNSIVIFSPSNNTMHGVKANYNHLQNQRTQLYGNLWYSENKILQMPAWEDFVINTSKAKAPSLSSKIKASIPDPLRQFVKKKILNKADVIASRKTSKSD